SILLLYAVNYRTKNKIMDINQKQSFQLKPKTRLIHFVQGVALTLFTLTVIIAIYLTYIYCTKLSPFINYAIIFDAGSSHTKMYVYSWPADKSNGLGTTSTVNEYFDCSLSTIVKTLPTTSTSSMKKADMKFRAISDFENHLEYLEEYFHVCLEGAKIKIPSNRHGHSPIFLGATAGMRLLSLRNRTKAENVLEKIREIFHNNPFQFVIARQVRILTGLEEAIDGWITTNLLLEKFKHKHESYLRHSSDDIDTDMVGVLDLGGASTQVTFTHNNLLSEPIPLKYTANITLFDKVYSPYAHSYLCWGKNEVHKRYRARLINEQTKNWQFKQHYSRLIIDDYCLPNHANESLSWNYIFRSPCTINEKKQFSTQNISMNVTTLLFYGRGNSSMCEKAILNLLNAKKDNKNISCAYNINYCSFDHTYQPTLPAKNKFIGLSGYYYVFNNLAYGLHNRSNKTFDQFNLKNYRLSDIKQRVNDICETPYELYYKQEDMSQQNEQHKRTMCFDGWYVWLLLTSALGWKEEDFKRLSFVKRFPTGEVGWTLGYMINQTNYIPAEHRNKIIQKNEFVLWLCLILTIALASFIF
ncbi:unnamed protein product, partial [Didymodactylos carnosus]